MWWFVLVFCFSVVLGGEPDHTRSAEAVGSTNAMKKNLIIQHLSKKDTFLKQQNSPFNAFCIKDVLENPPPVVQKFEVAENKYYRINLIILGGLGSEDSIGKCRDKTVLIRQMRVSLLLTESSENPGLWTSSFTLHDVRIEEQEGIAMTWWLKSEPNIMQTLIEEGKLKLNEVPTKVTFDTLAMRFPGAPWIPKPTIPQMLEPLVPVNTISNSLKVNNDALEENDDISKENAERLQRNAARLRGALPPFRGALPSSRGNLPSSRGALPSSRGVLPSSRGALPSSRGVLPSSRGALPSSRGAVPSSRGGSALPRRSDPMRRGGKSRRNAIAKPGSK